MGDRATIQLYQKQLDGEDEFSPVIYLHWAGRLAPEILAEAAPIMRRGDISYAFARLAGVCHLQTEPEQGLSYGISNADAVQREDTAGDNGHFLVEIVTGEVEHFGGYTGPVEDLELGRF